MDADNLHRRLKKIIGQVQAIDRMIDEDVPCEDVLAQINAAKSALHGCGKVVLEGHIKHCVRDGIQHGDADKTKERRRSNEQCMDADNLHRRLKKIIGQVQAIDRMIDEDVPCEDVLAQINAAKSALHGCGKVVLEGHIKHCVRDGIQHGDADKTIESFTKAVERFSNMC